MSVARTISTLALMGSLIGCSSSSGLPTQRAYSVASIEQPQSVSFYCGTLLAVAPAILPNPIPPGIGITPGISRWLVGLHAGSSGPNGVIQVSAGFLDLYGIASAPEAPLTEYTVLLNNGAAVVVMQNDPLPQLYPNEVNLPTAPPNTAVVVRVVGNSGRVMNNQLPPGLCTQGSLQIQPPVLASYPSGMTHSFLASGGVVYMHYPSGGLGTGF
jgi:hypothetical protein